MATPDSELVPPGTDSSTEKVKLSGLRSYLRIFIYFDRTCWILYSVTFAAAVVAGAALPVMDLVFGKFVTVFNNFTLGSVEPDDFMSEVSKYSLYLVYLFIAKFFLVYIHSVASSIAALRATKALRLHYLRSLLRQDTSYFDSTEADSPAVLGSMNGNLIINGISEKLSVLIQSFSTFVAAFVVAFAVQWKLTLITSCIVPAIVIIAGTCMSIEMKSENQLMAIFGRASSLAEEVFSSISTVHAFWLQGVMAKRYDEYLDEMERVGRKKSPNYGFLFSSEFFCIFSGYGLAFWQGIHMFSRGEVKEPGDIVTVVFALVLAATSLTHITPQILTITKAATAAREMFSVIDKRSKIDSLSMEGLVPDKCVGQIEVKEVKFSYPSRPETQVFDSLSLSFGAGKTTALVGTSGSGKSTIIGLLERWYDPTSGAILLDGVDIRTIKVVWLRTQIRLVEQESVLFSGTVFDNVAFGLEGTPYADLTSEEKLRLVEKACRDTYAHEFIETLPRKYDTEIGEHGRNLSGGQKQRIAIARSIVSNPSILLLDEATSALDSKAERTVQRALDNVTTGRTTIIIAHRLSTIQRADNIVVMSMGEIIEQGAHFELLRRDGAYARLVQAQSLYGNDGNAEDDVPGFQNAGVANERKACDFIMQDKPQDPVVLSTGVQDQALGTGETMGYSLVWCLWLLIRELRELWSLYAIVAITCSLGGGIFPAQAVIMARTFQVFQMREDEAINRGDFWALMFFTVALASWCFYFILGWIANVIIQKVSRRYRHELFQSTIRQDLNFFDLKHNATGAICSRLLINAIDLNELLGVNSGLILINIATVISVSILGIAYGWKLGLVCVLGALPPLLLSGYFRIRLEYGLQERTEVCFASSAAVAAEAVAAIRTVSSLTLERRVLDIYHVKLDLVVKESTKTLAITMIWYGLTQSINFLAMALGFWYGGKLMSTYEYTNEQFFVIFLAVVVGGEHAAAVFHYATTITKATASANYLFWLRHRVPGIDNSYSEEPSLHRPRKEEDAGSVVVQCQGLGFTYPSQSLKNVLSNIDITIPPCTFVAFVGSSGCGKSTMIKLLCRFYDPTSGCITLDDGPICELQPQDHRHRLALVKQEPVLFQGSIRENVALGMVESAQATDFQIEEACKSANIYDFVMSLPDGLNTNVGLRRSQLSGGQRQRVAIARALIRNAKILLLDEATSALDTENEWEIQAAIKQTMKKKDRSVVAVAHRLSTIKDADCIFVFQSGRIVEKGTHNELLAKRAIYWQMCIAQSLDKASSPERKGNLH